jgi:hypothetical protein
MAIFWGVVGAMLFGGTTAYFNDLRVLVPVAMAYGIGVLQAIIILRN